jgi:SAM-dependent methyltransferase
MSKTNEQVNSHISKDEHKSINTLFKRVDSNKEFEFIFFSKKREEMNKEKYVLLLKFMRAMKNQPNYKVDDPHQTLDISYSAKPGLSYRIEIKGEETIRKQLNRITNIQNRNYVIYKFLLQMIMKGAKNISIMLKSREEGDTVDVDDLNLRARLSSEIDLTEFIRKGKLPEKYSDPLMDSLLKGDQLSLEVRNKLNSDIIFRLKGRTSLYFDGVSNKKEKETNSSHFSRIDLTNTKTVNNVKKLSSIFSHYELEIEYGAQSKSDVKSEHLDKVYSMVEMVLKLVQQSGFIVGNSQSEKVVTYYKDLMGLTDKINGLVARQAVSLEVQHATEILPNRYALTDKADGDRYFLIIMDGSIYLISSNLNVRDTGIVLSDKLAAKYNGTVMDGEFLFVKKERRHMFMTFDCLRTGKRDIRDELKLMTRLAEADKIIDDCFIFKGQKGFNFKDLPTLNGGFDINKVRDFHGKELVRFYKTLNEDIQQVKQYPLIRRKFFMVVTGAKPWEIFSYSVEYWNKYTKDSDIKFPYLLDGLMYHPLEQAYVIRESKYAEYKWKPPSKNSIDFYIEFIKDKNTNRVMDIYDNSNNDQLKNKLYRICKLHVGQSVKGKEYPVPFSKNGVVNCYLYLEDGAIRDEMGDIISDKTVVELYYQNDPNIIPEQRWVPIKTRYDKTESVERYGRKYGNYSTTADRIWRSIINPILMDDMIELAKGNTPKKNFYDKKISEMNKSIDHSLIVEVNKENKYYQKQTKLAYTMRQYHNFIKSNLIYTYCNKMYNSNNQLSVLDIACGRGGDINKFYYAAIASYVGIDLSEGNLNSPVDGAISRYNTMRKRKPNFPSMYFIQADARSILEYDAQLKALSGMSDKNKKLLERFFSSTGKKIQYDRINCQMAIHYFFESKHTWNNFKQNIKNHLRAGGYFMATTLDAKQVVKAIGNNDSYSEYLDDKEGNKNIFFGLVKKYDEITDLNKTIGVAQAIDVHLSWFMNEGVYMTEYLVDPDFIKEELERDCDMELVDTDLFQNQMAINEELLTDSVDYESVEETKNYLRKAGRYYEDNDVNAKSRAYTNLHRYYVFRKKDSTTKSNKQTKLKGGDSENESTESDEFKTKSRSKSKSKKTSKIGRNVNSDLNLDSVYNFADEKKYRIPAMENYDIHSSLIGSIHKILASHSMIPKSINVKQFTKDQDIEFRTDVDADNTYIKDLVTGLNFDHEINDKIVNVMNGMDLYLVERDCNNYYDVEYIKGANNKKNGRAILLMKENLLYKPVMRREEKGIRGMFKLNDPLVKYLETNGTEL